MGIKFLLLFAIFFCAEFASQAQINTGRYLTGGSLNIYDAKYNQPAPQSKVESANPTLQFGKVIKENTVVGVILSYDYFHVTESPDSNFSKSNSYSLGIFYRKYKKLAKNFYFFGEVNAAYTHTYDAQGQSSQNENNSSKSFSDGGSVSFIPGISYAVCKRMQLELLMPNILGVSYSHEKTNFNPNVPPATPDQESHIFSFNTNFNANFFNNFGIGFKFFLGK